MTTPRNVRLATRVARGQLCTSRSAGKGNLVTKVLRGAGLVVAAFSPLVAVGMIAGPASAAGRHSLLGSKPTWASGKARSGPAASSSAIAGRVALAFNHAADARALAAAVSDRRSPQ